MRVSTISVKISAVCTIYPGIPDDVQLTNDSGAVLVFFIVVDVQPFDEYEELQKEADVLSRRLRELRDADVIDHDLLVEIEQRTRAKSPLSC